MEKVAMKPEEVLDMFQEMVSNYVANTEKMDEMTEQVLQKQKEGFEQLQRSMESFLEQSKDSSDYWNNLLDRTSGVENNPTLKEFMNSFNELSHNYEQAMVKTTTNSLQLMQHTHEKMTETIQLLMRMQKENQKTTQNQMQSSIHFWNTSTQQFYDAMQQAMKMPK